LIHAVVGCPETLAKVRTVERAWIAYRDVCLEAIFPVKAKQAEYGSIFPTDADLFLADLTRQQTIMLTILREINSGCGFNSDSGCVHPLPQ
jgi:uncharacterized protein YecT (DUF1311 family)